MTMDGCTESKDRCTGVHSYYCGRLVAERMLRGASDVRDGGGASNQLGGRGEGRFIAILSYRPGGK